VAQLAFLFCSFVWGTSFILLERVTHALGPVEIGIWRMLCGSAVVGFCWWTQRGRYRLSRRDLANIVFSSVLFSAPPNVIQAYVLSQGYGHGFFGTMVAAIPLLTILVSMPMLGVVPTWRELVGVLGGLFCIFMLMEDGVSRGMSVGLLALTLVIPLSSAMSNTFIKWRLAHVPAAPLTTIVLLTAAFTMMPLEFFQGTLHSMRIAAPEGASVTMSAVIYLVLLGMVGSGVSTMAFNWMVLEKGPLFAGMTTYVVPVLALLWGTVDGETIRPVQMVAIAGALGMVALVQSGRPETDESEAPAIVPISSFQAAEVEAKVA
jgi:drug/metabolite transporter (DMT)-like permease